VSCLVHRPVAHATGLWLHTLLPPLLLLLLLLLLLGECAVRLRGSRKEEA
jgi:hypothetical protein